MNTDNHTSAAWRLHNQAAALLAAARDTIDLALDPDNTEPVTEEHAQRAADLCEMAVEKCAAWLAAERDCAS